MALTNSDLPKLIELLNQIDIRVQVRRRTAAEWAANDEVLLAGEWGRVTDTGELKQGDGVTAFSALMPVPGVLVDPGSDRLLFWDASEGSYRHLSPGSGLTISGDTITASGGGGGSSFSPADLFDASVTNGAWYDPNDISTLWQDVAGTIPVTTAGQAVARMDDKSGLGNHAAQSTSAARPTYQVGDLKGYLSFDGGDYLECGTAFNAEAFMAGVAYFTTSNNVRLLDARGTGVFGTVKGWYMKGRNSTTDLLCVDDGSSAVAFNDEGITLSAPHVLIMRYAASRLRYTFDTANLTSQKSVTGTLGTITNATQPSRIGTASNAAGTQSLVGRFYQAVVINRHGSFNEQRDLHEYMTQTADF